MALPEDKKTYKNLFPVISIDGIKIADLWRAWVLTEEFKEKIKLFGTYLLAEGDRWDTVAEDVYGDRELWWVLVMFNDIEDPFSIYYDKSITDGVRILRIPKQEDVSFMLNEIRKKRLEFELSDEEEIS